MIYLKFKYWEEQDILRWTQDHPDAATGLRVHFDRTPHD